ncbi:MAG: hypothetical protein KBF11_02610 [Desulfomicrobium sp.]|jgi:hypothetical protein|nr:hypothetical protein [Desulfomicrobium sp.]
MSKAPRKNPILPRIIVFAVGLLLALYGAVMPLLPYIGARASGEITVIRRELGDRQDPMPNRYSYSVGYEFPLPDGRIVFGNTKTIGSATSAGMSKGASGVYYLPALPYVNALEIDTRFDVGKIALLAAGIFLCLASGTRRIRS